MALRGEQDQDSEWQIIPQEELKQSEYDLQRISKKHSTSNILITNVQFPEALQTLKPIFPKAHKDNFTPLRIKEHVVRGKI